MQPSRSPVARHRQIDRRWAVIVSVTIAAELLLGGVVALILRAPEAAPRSVWAAITSQLTGESVPKDAALEAFAYLYRVAIPGVTVPAGDDAADKPTSGSGAMRWVRAHWSELTREQQAVINRFVLPGPNDTIVNIDLGAELQGRGPAVASVGGAFGLPVVDVRAHGDTALATAAPPRSRAGAPQDLVDAMRKEVLADVARIGPRLGMDAISPGMALWTNITLTLSDQDGGNTLFTTLAAVNGAGIYSPCNITAWHNAWENEPVVNGGVSPALHTLITHEVVHCYQNVIWGSVPTALAIPPWITEGTALWLAADDTQHMESMVDSQWRTGWFAYPGRALTVRTYDGFGYYALLDHLGRPLWSLMKAAWTAAAGSPDGSRSNPFIAALDGDATDVVDSWGPSFVREDAWGDPWQTHGLGLPSGVSATRTAIAARNDPVIASVDSRANAVRLVTGSEGEIVALDTNGIASVHEQDGGNSMVGFQSRRFCVQGDCICPPDTARAGERMADDNLKMPFVLTVNAGLGGSQFRVMSRSLRDECGTQQDDPPFPAGGSAGGSGGGSGGGGGNPCGGQCGGSNGDPHVTTVNSKHYDFQAAGEFVLLRSRDGSVEIQGRQEPYGKSGTVSINTAVAARANGRRVGVYVTASGLQARVDGDPVDLGQPVDLGGGAVVERIANGVAVRFPDGTVLYAVSVGRYGINAQVHAATGLRTNGVGVLGPVPLASTLPALPDGTRIPATSDPAQSFATLYGAFADAWRVTDQTTLFDYDAGRSTSSYQLAGFPAKPAPASLDGFAADQVAAARAACAGVHDLDLLAQCVLDVLVTGDHGFVDGYALTASFTRVAAATPAGGPSRPSPSPVQVATATPAPRPSISGHVEQGKIGPVLQNVGMLTGSALAPDGTLYIESFLPKSNGQDQSQVAAIDPKTGTVRKTAGPFAWAGKIAFAAGSVWASDLDSVTDCSIERLDPATLAQQARIDVPCDISGATFVAAGDAIWYVDRTGADINGHGGHLRRIDPQTNTPDSAVELPKLNGYLSATTTAIFYGGGPDPVWRLRLGQTTFEEMGTFTDIVQFGGDGVWEMKDHQAVFHAAPGGTDDRAIPVEGSLVQADGAAAYADVIGPGSVDELARFPLDGSEGQPVLTSDPSAPESAGHDFGYFDNDPLLIADGQVVKLWQVVEQDGTTTIYLQWGNLPG